MRRAYEWLMRCDPSRMLTYADVCWRMLTYADVCEFLSVPCIAHTSGWSGATPRGLSSTKTRELSPHGTPIRSKQSTATPISTARCIPRPRNWRRMQVRCLLALLVQKHKYSHRTDICCPMYPAPSKLVAYAGSVRGLKPLVYEALSH